MIHTVGGDLILRVATVQPEGKPWEASKQEQEVLVRRILEIEQWLNIEVAKLAFEKFGLGLRAHLQFPERTT